MIHERLIPMRRYNNAMKDPIGEKYHITINDVTGGNDDKLAKARQDVVYK